MIKLDHVIVAVPDLAASVSETHRRIGVLPVFGGQHPTLGTHNALFSLNQGCYLELLARDPSLEAETNPVLERLKGMSGPTFFGWALQCDNFSEVSALLERSSPKISDMGSGSRRTPAGELLKYEYANIEGLSDLGPARPFFIRWVDTVHPSLSSPQGCDLLKMTLLHLPSLPFAKFVNSLNLGIELRESEANDLELQIASPRGNFTLP